MSYSEPTSGGGRTVLIVVIVVVVLVVGVLAICAGLAYFGIQRMTEVMKPMQEMVEDLQRAPSVVEDFLDDIRANRLEAAHQSTTEAFKKRMTLKQFQELIEKHPALKEMADSSDMDVDKVDQNQPFGGNYRFRYKAKSKDGKDQVEFTVKVSKEDGQLKVDDLKVFQAVTP
jgi:Tfp pilus assembly protein PilE